MREILINSGLPICRGHKIYLMNYQMFAIFLNNIKYHSKSKQIFSLIQKLLKFLFKPKCFSLHSLLRHLMKAPIASYSLLYHCSLWHHASHCKSQEESLEPSYLITPKTKLSLNSFPSSSKYRQPLTTVFSYKI